MVCGWSLGKRKEHKLAERCFYCADFALDIPLHPRADEPCAEPDLMSGGCKCPACPGCWDYRHGKDVRQGRSARMFCGWSLGKKKEQKRAERCFYCAAFAPGALPLAYQAASHDAQDGHEQDGHGQEESHDAQDGHEQDGHGQEEWAGAIWARATWQRRRPNKIPRSNYAEIEV